MRQDLLLDDALPSAGRPAGTDQLTGPSSENIALGLSSCSWIRRSMSSADPIISVMSIFCFLSRPLAALSVSRAEGRYPFPLACLLLPRCASVRVRGQLTSPPEMPFLSHDRQTTRPPTDSSSRV